MDRPRTLQTNVSRVTKELASIRGELSNFRAAMSSFASFAQKMAATATSLETRLSALELDLKPSNDAMNDLQITVQRPTQLPSDLALEIAAYLEPGSRVLARFSATCKDFRGLLLPRLIQRVDIYMVLHKSFAQFALANPEAIRRHVREIDLAVPRNHSRLRDINITENECAMLVLNVSKNATQLRADFAGNNSDLDEMGGCLPSVRSATFRYLPQVIPEWFPRVFPHVKSL